MRFGFLVFACPFVLFGIPTLSNVSIGQAKISISENHIDISASDQSLIDWVDFSLNVDESAHFHLPNETSLTVNRVVGNQISAILGKLHSNGKIVLMNPNGVIFGKNSEIHAPSLIASTLDLNEQLFKEKGIFSFDGTSKGKIEHLGTAHIGNELQLNAGKISISGEILAPSGSVSLIGDEINLFSTIDVSPSGSISVKGLKTNVYEGSLLSADGIDQENGGHIYLFGEERIKMAGHLSAQGGEFGGHGGILEISTHRDLDFTGTVSTLAPLGKTGELIIDPLDLTVAGANVNVTGASPFTPTGGGATLDAATVIAALGVANVTITTVGTVGAAAGNITINSPITWSAATQLTISAVGSIFVNNNIQHDTAAIGGLLMNAAGDINIFGALAPGVSAGSQNAVTAANAGGNINIIGGTLANRYAQLGYFTPTGVSASGPIFATSVDLNLITGDRQRTGVQLGHGKIVDLPAGSPSTLPGANITVNAAGNVNIISLRSNVFAVIGNGAPSLDATSQQNGNITVLCGGNLTLNGDAAPVNSVVQIGHCIPDFNLDNGPTLTGNIDVRVGNNTSFLGNGLIGHGGRFNNTSAQIITGDITLACGGNLTMDIDGPNGQASMIGHFVTIRGGFPLASINGNYNFSIGGDLIVATDNQDGWLGYIGPNDTPQLNITLNTSICGNVFYSSVSPVVGGRNFLGIGLFSANFAAGTAQTNIAIGGNISAPNLGVPLFLGCNRSDFYLSIGGDLDLTGKNSRDAYITSGPVGITRVFVGGDIRTSIVGLGIFIHFGRGFLATFQTTDIDVRAGGDIEWPTGYNPALPGGVNIQAGHSFASGDLWTGTTSQITSIAGNPLSFNLLNGSCQNFATSAPITSTCGTFFKAGGINNSLPLSNGSNLTVTGNCTSCSGATNTITIGNGVGNDFFFTTPIGAVNIGPNETINVNQDIISTSSISITACGDLNINPGTDITSTGLGSPITLIADFDNSGAGNLNLLGGNITSNNGDICLLAGPGTFGCDGNNCPIQTIGSLVLGSLASVNHVSGAVSSGAGLTYFVASGDILIDGSAISVGTTTGPIALTAGRNITILEDIVSTGSSITMLSGSSTSIDSALVSAGGEIRINAGFNIDLDGTASLVSASSRITLVVDSLFPNRPFIGPGAFNMSCGSSISSGGGEPVRIFTAMRNLNTLCGLATINGFLVSDPTFGFGTGALFEDTPYEMWCTYFDCAIPYPFPSLGRPFTVFYKDCLQIVTQQAMIIVDEFLSTLSPYNEFPGWEEKFHVDYAEEELQFQNAPYMIRRKQLQHLDHPKSYTVRMPE